MNLRRTTSLTALLTFPVVVATSVVLYLMPHGRVAYWSDWHWLGLSKDQWGAIHVNVGFLFLAALLLHTWYNWRPIVSYLRAKARAAPSPDLAAALAITLFCLVGTWAEIPPFSQFAALGEGIKTAASERYGEPPYGHAELSSLKTFLRRVELDPAKALAALERAGFRVDGATASIKEIAAQKGATPQELYRIMREAAAPPPPPPGALPPEPAPGLGKLTLAEFCAKHGLDPGAVVAGLKAGNLEADPSRTLKAIGDAAGIAPSEVYERIRELAPAPAPATP